MATVESPNRRPKQRRRNGAETREQLLSATMSLIARHDFFSITLDQVSAAVGVSKSSILWHFGSKEGLLTEAVLKLLDEMERSITLQKARFSTVAERIAYLLESVADYFDKNPPAKGIMLSLIFNSQAPAAIRDRINEHLHQEHRRVIEFLSEEGDEIGDSSAAAIIALIHGCYIQWYADGCPDDLRERLTGMYSALPIGTD